MHYLMLCCFDEEQWEALPEQEREAIMARYRDLEQSLVASGHYLGGAKLEPVAAATTVRLRNGQPAITDGPYAETKETIGGYHLIACRDLDEALAIARRIPTLPAGGAIEVRPVAYLAEGV